jgi:hypothetical protein
MRIVGRGAQGGNGTTQLDDAALVATVADHVVNARGSEQWMLILRFAG